MSYVLDALRRAEKDRSRNPDPGLNSMDTPDWTAPPDRQQTSRLAFVSLVASFCLLVLLVLFYFASRSSDELISEQSGSDSSQLNSTNADSGTAIEPALDQAIDQAIDQARTRSPEEPNVSSFEVLGEKNSVSNPGSILENTTDISAQDSFRQQVQSMDFQGGLFNPQDSSKSYVFRGDNAFRVGDMIAENVYLLDISQDFLVISDGYEEIIYYLD